jgi:metal-dependent amidase/aminoacylase/carboxypeptidase family protein
MDGLPVAEETGLPFASAHPGVMHACGHDVHMTIGLGVLEQVLNRVQRHSFVFLFQPAEENISGAQEICDAGLLDEYRISECYALHVSPEWDAGVIATRPGGRRVRGRAGDHGVGRLRLPAPAHPGDDVLARHRAGAPAALGEVRGR